MSSIDNRIVRMTFDNNKFEKDIATTMKSLEKFDKSLEFKDASRGFEDLTRAANKVDLSNLTSSIDSIKSHFTVLGRFIDRHVDQMIYKVENFGRSLYNQFAKGPRTQGFQEYELKMGSIQTIMNATGESLESVNGYLEELNEYSDKTIYSFSDMTSNIAKFTNAGVKLDDAVGAIQGISNWAALSGANANEASRAMYNLSQALSSGFVRLVDWKSIEYANMATVEVKQTLIDTAKSLGVLDDQYQFTTESGKKQKVSLENFNDSLQHQWLTSEVLINTLSKFSDEETELGKRAYAAAQDIKTFTQLTDTLKESIGSGWAQSYELIFGDLEEAKQLFTGISNELNGIVGGISDWRNELLSTWKSSGGRTALLSGLKTIWDIFKGLGTTIKDSFLKVFKPLPKIVNRTFGTTIKEVQFADESVSKLFDGFDLAKISKNFESAAKGIMNWFTVVGDDGKSRLDKISKGFEGIFTIVKVLGGALSWVGSSIWKVIEPLISIVGDATINAFSDFGQIILDIYDTFSKNKNVTSIINTLSDAVNHLADGISRLASFIFGNLGTGVGGILDWVISLFGSDQETNAELKEDVTVVDKAVYLFDRICDTISHWYDVISARIEPYLAPIRGFFNGLWKTVSESFAAQGFQASIQSGWNYITDFFGNIDFGPVGDFFKNLWSNIINFFSPQTDETGKTTTFLERVQNIFNTLSGFIVDIYTQVSNFLSPYLSPIGDFFKNLWSNIINFFSPQTDETGKTTTFLERVQNGFSVIVQKVKTWLFSLKTGVQNVINAVSGGAISIGEFIGNALSILWSGIKGFFTGLFSSIDLGKFVDGLVSFVGKISWIFAGTSIPTTILLIALAIKQFAKSAKNLTGSLKNISKLASAKAFSQKMDALSEGVLKIAAGIALLAGSVWLISKIDPDRLVPSLIALGGILLGLVLFSRIVKEKSLDGVMQMGVGLLAIIRVLKQLADMSAEDFLSSLLKLVPILAVLVIFDKLTTKSSGFSMNGMLELGLGLIFIVKAISTLASLDPEGATLAVMLIIPLLLTLGVVSRLMTKKIDRKQKLGKNSGLVGMALGLVLVVLAMKVLATMDPEQLITSLLAVEILIITMGVISQLLSKRLKGDTKISKAGLSIIALAFAIDLMAAAMIGISTLSGGDVLKGLGAIIALMGTVIVFTKLNKGADPTSMLAGLASLWGTITLFIFAMNSLKGYDAAQIGTVAGSIGVMLLSMAGAIAIVQKVPVSGALTAAANIGLFGTVLTAIVGVASAAFGAINEWMGGKAIEYINKGAEVIRSVGHAVGSLFAGFADAFKTTGTYETIDNEFTTEFAGQMKEVGEIGKGVDLSGVDLISQAVTKLGQAANQIPKEGGLWQRIVGNTDIKGFGEGMSGLATSLVTFSANAAGLVANKEAALAAIDVLGGIVDKVRRIPGKGGLLQKLVGEIDISTFATQLGALGAGLANFAQNSAAGVGTAESGAAFSSLEQMQANATAMSTVLGSIVTAVKDIPESGGLLQNLVGGIDITKFADQLGNLGTGLVKFSTNTKDISVNENTTKAIGLISQIGTAADSIPGSGGILQAIVGTHDLGSFGNDMTELAKGLVNFSSAAVDMKATPEQIDSVISIVTKLGTASSNIPDSSWFTKVFGGLTGLHDLGDFSADMQEFAAGVKELGLTAAQIPDFKKLEKMPDLLGKFVDASNKLEANETDGAWIVKLFGGDLTGLTSLGGALESFAASMRVANESFEDVDTGRIETIIGLLTGMATAASLVSGNGNGNYSNLTGFVNMLGANSGNIASDLWDLTESISNPISETIDEAIKILQNSVSRFETAGLNIGKGLAGGIRKGRTPILGAVYAIVSAVTSAFNFGFLIRSPSRVTQEMGMYLDLGLAEGISGYSSDVEQSIDRMVSRTRTQFETICGIINSALSTSSYTPRITPVVDMDHTRRTAGTINSMLANQNGIKINGTLSASLANRITPTVNVATNLNSSLENSIERMNSRIDELGHAVTNMEVVLDSGVLVGKLSTKMDKRLGTITSRKGRG